MGVENNECIIATTWSNGDMQKVKEWVATLPDNEQSLFAFLPSLVNGKQTLFLAPDGSKKGAWIEAQQGQNLRNNLVDFLKTFAYEDGSNPFSFIEAGYGEYGQKILRGNCNNLMNSADYYVE